MDNILRREAHPLLSINLKASRSILPSFLEGSIFNYRGFRSFVRLHVGRIKPLEKAEVIVLN
jgi:hypothetical protein